MDNFLGNFDSSFLSNCGLNCDNLDINKLLVILLILTGRLKIESITVFPNDFTVTLGTFRILWFSIVNILTFWYTLTIRGDSNAQ